MRRLALFVVPLFVLACGGGGDNGGADGGGGVSDEAYFALALGTCHLLQGGAGGVQEMIIGAEKITEGFTELRYRNGGFLRRTDYVTLESGEVRIHRRIEVGNPGLDVEFDPPVVFLRRPVRSTGTDPIVTDTTATGVSTGAADAWRVEVTVGDASSLTVPAGTFDAAMPVFVVYDRADTGTKEQDILYFEAEQGFLRADLHGGDWPEMDLLEVRTMGTGETTCTGS